MRLNRSFSIVLTAIGIGVLLCCVLSAQEPTELEFILSCNPIQNTRVSSGVSYTPGLKTLFTGAIRFYQLFLSTQDMPSCNFTPSCSRFAMESIRYLGIIRGVLLASDRLQRCNSMSIARYDTDHKSGLFIDPVQLYQEILQ